MIRHFKEEGFLNPMDAKKLILETEEQRERLNHELHFHHESVASEKAFSIRADRAQSRAFSIYSEGHAAL